MTNLNAASFETLRAMPNGPIKKFYLIKNFRVKIIAATGRDPRAFGCDELCALIQKTEQE